MEISEALLQHQLRQQGDQHNDIGLRKFLLALNFSIMIIGDVGSPMVSRVYFLHGGSQKWLSSCLQAGAWPLMLIPLSISYPCRCRGGRRNNSPKLKVCFITPLLFASCTVLGVLTGAAIPREARQFGLGEGKYYLVLIWSAILWQFYFLGSVGVVFYGSSLLTGIIVADLIPAAEILAVIFFHEKFTGGKGLSLALSLLGFLSYFYGEQKQNKKKINGVESPQEETLPA